MSSDPLNLRCVLRFRVESAGLTIQAEAASRLGFKDALINSTPASSFIATPSAAGLLPRKQATSASMNFDAKKTPTRRERFLGEMDQVVRGASCWR